MQRAWPRVEDVFAELAAAAVCKPRKAARYLRGGRRGSCINKAHFLWGKSHLHKTSIHVQWLELDTRTVLVGEKAGLFRPFADILRGAVPC